MKRNIILATALAASVTILTGCAGYNNSQMAQTYPGYAAPSQAYVSYGVVDSIQLIQAGAPNSGVLGTSNEAVAGTVIGGIAGGVLGHQVGKGAGNTAATVIGAVGGAAAGNIVGQRMGSSGSGNLYEIRVRLENGNYQAIRQNNLNNLQVGSRVRIENGVVYPN